MSTSRTSLFVVGFLAAALGSQLATEPRAEPPRPEDRLQADAAVAPSDENKESKTQKKGRGKFTISKETTYVTEPLHKDGYPDYARALNQRLSQGVTPENNANVLLWKALGPKPTSKPMPAEFFQWLGMRPPPERGEYFIDLKDFIKVDPRGKEGEELDERLDRLVQRPLIAKQNEDIVSWLQANESALILVVEATKRSLYFSPLVPPQGKEGPSWLIGAPLSGVQGCRGLANALAARAMLRLEQGKYDDAWQDLLACHRLGRLVGRGPTFIEALAGIAMDGVAAKADLAFLDRVKLDEKRVQSCLRDLQKLPLLPAVAEKVDLAERFVFLDSVMMIDRHGIRYLTGLSPGPSKDSDPLAELPLVGIDWDPALQNINRWCDRLAATMRERDPARRQKRLKEIDVDVKTLKSKTGDPGEKAKLLLGGAKARGELFGDIIICLMLPAVLKVHSAEERIRQVQDNLCVGFALAWYHCDHEYYPKTLDALAPNYLKQIPLDIFSGKPLIYRPSEKGFLLYSVGRNGKDDGGHGPEDDPPGDDLVVRIPLPEMPRKK